MIAYHNPALDVTVVDRDAERIAAWESTQLPIHEQGLLDIVSACRNGTCLDRQSVAKGIGSTSWNCSKRPGKASTIDMRLSPTSSPGRRRNLFFSTNLKQAIEEADLVFISVNTPTKLHGTGQGFASDLSDFESAARSIAIYGLTDKIVVEKSTVPCGTAKALRELVSSAGVTLSGEAIELRSDNLAARSSRSAKSSLRGPI